jgi:FkbM family methyltransferase
VKGKEKREKKRGDLTLPGFFFRQIFSDSLFSLFSLFDCVEVETVSPTPAHQKMGNVCAGLCSIAILCRLCYNISNIAQGLHMSSNTLVGALKANWHYLRSQRGFRRAPLCTILRLLCWRIQCLLGISAIIKLRRWGARFFLPPKWQGPGATTIFAFREHYEPELAYLEHFVSPGSVVLDAGASLGIYTVAAGNLVGDSGLVLSFEPGAESFSVLERNIKLNCLRNVRAFRAALSDHEGSANLYHHAPGPTLYSLGADRDLREKSEEVITTTIDSMLKREGVDSLDFLKMDVEGAEELVLRGASSLLRCARPVIIFEINPEAAERLRLSFDGAWNFLDGFGYQFFAIGNVGKLQKLVFPPAGGNVVAIQRGHK